MRTSLVCVLIVLAALLVWGAATWHLPEDDMARTIFWELRLPRLLLASSCGAALAMAGLCLQTLFRHPLVEPGLLGVSSGASTFLVLASAFGVVSAAWMPLFAFVGALAALAVVLLIARQLAWQSDAILLIGVVISALLSAVIQILLLMAPDGGLRASQFWLMGSFAHVDVQLLWPSLFAMVLLLVFGMRSARHLDVWLLGEREAALVGMPVNTFRYAVLWGSALLVGLSVAQAGVVAFIGLMAPHIASRLCPVSHRYLLPASAMIGALLALLADALAQHLLYPNEIPVGIFTALLGAPFFLYVLKQRWSA